MDNIAISIRQPKIDNYKEMIDAIVETNFKNVFIEWYNHDIKLQNEVLKYAKLKGLNIIFAHLSYENCNYIWEDNKRGDDTIDSFLKDIIYLKNFGINDFIIHTTYKFNDPKVTDIGINRIKKLARYAKLINTRICFENVELSGYLEGIIKNIDADNIGICFDIGHSHLFFNEKINTSLFKDRMFHIHLHDNYGKDDDHNLPFDGEVNWINSIIQIKDANYKGYITLETYKSKKYENMTYIEFYTKARKIAEELKKLIEK